MRLLFEQTLSVEGLSCLVAHPIVRPDDLERYLLDLLRRGAPEASPYILSGARLFRTRRGWPGCLVASANAVAARYDMLHLVAGVVVIAERAEILAGTVDELEAYLRSARPDFHDEQVCIATLWT